MSSAGLAIQCSILEGHVRGGLQSSPVRALQGNQVLVSLNAKTYYLYTQSASATSATPAALTSYMQANAATIFAGLAWNESYIGEWDPATGALAFGSTNGLTPSAQITQNNPVPPFLGFLSDTQWQIYGSFVSQYPEAFGSSAVVQYAVQICQVQMPAFFPFSVSASYGGPPIGFVPLNLASLVLNKVTDGVFTSATVYQIPVPTLTFRPVTGGGNINVLCGRF